MAIRSSGLRSFGPGAQPVCDVLRIATRSDSANARAGHPRPRQIAACDDSPPAAPATSPPPPSSLPKPTVIRIAAPAVVQSGHQARPDTAITLTDCPNAYQTGPGPSN